MGALPVFLDPVAFIVELVHTHDFTVRAQVGHHCPIRPAVNGDSVLIRIRARSGRRLAVSPGRVVSGEAKRQGIQVTVPARAL